MDHRYAKDPKTREIMLRCMDGMALVRAEIDRIISEQRNKIEDPQLSDAEVRSYLGVIKGLKLALGFIPKE